MHFVQHQPILRWKSFEKNQIVQIIFFLHFFYKCILLFSRIEKVIIGPRCETIVNAKMMYGPQSCLILLLQGVIFSHFCLPT